MDNQVPGPPRSYRVVAALAAFFILAGAGHFVVGRYRRGVAWLAAEAGWLLLFVLAALGDWPAGVWLGLFGLCGGRLAAVFDGLRVAPAAVLPRWGSTVCLLIILSGLGRVEPWALRWYVLEAFKIPSGAMRPTIEVGDHLFVDKLPRAPQRGQVIVFKYPVQPTQDFIKRIIGMPGDRVTVCGRQVLINGQPLYQEPIAGACQYSDADGAGGSGTPVRCVAYREWNGNQSYVIVHNEVSPTAPAPCQDWVVPKDSLFVMGDNRDNSHDSRYWGFVPYANRKGRAFFIYWSSGPTGVRWERINQLIHQGTGKSTPR